TAGPVFASIYLAQEAAIAGHGVALGVAPLVAEDLQRGRLVAPFEQVLANAHAFWLVRPRGGTKRPASDAFCDWLRREADGDAAPSARLRQRAACRRVSARPAACAPPAPRARGTPAGPCVPGR